LFDVFQGYQRQKRERASERAIFSLMPLDLQVKKTFFIELTDRAAVRAFYIIGKNLQLRFGVHAMHSSDSRMFLFRLVTRLFFAQAGSTKILPLNTAARMII
jgi:hypothetical protein